jgi:hypothetical protein
MTSQLATSVAAVLLVAAAQAPAQDLKYTLKFKDPAEGDVCLCKSKESSKVKIKIMDGQGNVTEDKTETVGHDTIFTVELLKKAGKDESGAVRRTYEKATSTKNGELTILGLEGKTIVIDKKGEKVQFRLEGGGELAAEDATMLNSELSATFQGSKNDTLPRQPIRINEPWTVGPEVTGKRATAEDAEYDMAKATMTCKLLRVYEKDKAQFGVVEYHWQIPFKKGAKKDAWEITGGSIVMHGTFDGCIDGNSFNHTTKFDFTYDMHAETTVNGLQYSLSIDGTGTRDDSRQDVGKK